VSRSIRPVRVNHVNLVVADYDESVRHFEARYGALFLKDLPQTAWHACLVDVGRVIFELFAPHEFFLHSRLGPHHIGIEYQADIDEVRAVLADHGIRVIRDLGVAVHTHPDDCFGVAFEFFDGHFHDNPALLDAEMRPAAYWRDEHRLGLTGLKGYTVVVREMAAARALLQSLFSCETVYDEPRQDIGARAVGLQVADAVLELLAPVEPLPDVAAMVEGIRSTIFGVRDIEQARRYFADAGVALVPGSAPGRLAVPAADNLGIRFEFAE
jgi:catechol 2,3-dioxygenase-like lactoylglutathione lyase family enzyme